MKHTNGRLYRWAIELENFDYEIVYQKGINNPADYLSRINHDEFFRTEMDSEIALCDIKRLFTESNDQKDSKILVMTRGQKKKSEKHDKQIKTYQSENLSQPISPTTEKEDKILVKSDQHGEKLKTKNS